MFRREAVLGFQVQDLTCCYLLNLQPALKQSTSTHRDLLAPVGVVSLMSPIFLHLLEPFSIRYYVPLVSLFLLPISKQKPSHIPHHSKTHRTKQGPETSAASLTNEVSL